MKTYLDGPCEIWINDDQGSFTIGVSDTHPSKYFAYVNIESDGAHGYWNETPDANHAQSGPRNPETPRRMLGERNGSRVRF